MNTYTVTPIATIESDDLSDASVEEKIAPMSEEISQGNEEFRDKCAKTLADDVKPLMKEVSGYKGDFELHVDFDSFLRVKDGKIEHLRSPVDVSIKYAEPLPRHDAFEQAQEYVQRMLLEETLKRVIQKISPISA